MRAMQHLKVSSFVALATISSVAFAQSQGLGWVRIQDLPEPIVLEDQVIDSFTGLTYGYSDETVFVNYWHVEGDASQAPPWTSAVAWLTNPTVTWNSYYYSTCPFTTGTWKGTVLGKLYTWAGTEGYRNSAEQEFYRSCSHVSLEDAVTLWSIAN
jgi:hypothetical protein